MADPISASWGLFQVRFQFLVQELATATFWLRRRREPTLQFEQVFRKPLEQLIDAFVAELDYLRGQHYDQPEIEELRALIAEIRALQDWRNPRIHSRIKLDKGIALCDWRTRKLLEMTEEDCNRQNDNALSVAARLHCTAGSLLSQIEQDERLRNEITQLFEQPD